MPANCTRLHHLACGQICALLSFFAVVVVCLSISVCFSTSISARVTHRGKIKTNTHAMRVEAGRAAETNRAGIFGHLGSEQTTSRVIKFNAQAACSRWCAFCYFFGHDLL